MLLVFFLLMSSLHSIAISLLLEKLFYYAQVAQYYHFLPASPFFSSSKGEMGHGLHQLMGIHEPCEDCYQPSSIAKTLNGWICCHDDLWALQLHVIDVCAKSISHAGFHQPLSICLCVAGCVYVYPSAAPFFFSSWTFRAQLSL